MDSALLGEVNFVNFPHLEASLARRTSDKTPRYNCIAWAAGDHRRKWWPNAGKEAFWPHSVAGNATTAAFVDAFRTKGYTECADGTLEPGHEKVALYVDGNAVRHAARQLVDGKWTSKLGDGPDIEHEILDVEGPLYGKATVFLKRETGAARSTSEKKRKRR